MGLNEIKLGVPVPYLIDLILRSLVGGRNSRDIMETGEFYPPEKLVQLGMIDQTLPLEEVQKSSMEKARLLGSFPERAFEAIKRNRVETIEAQFLMHRKEKEDLFLKCWFAEDTRKRLKEAMEKF